MQVSVEALEGLQRRMTVQVPAEEVDKEVGTRLQSLSRKARVDGFRPGKVPFKVAKRMFGPQVRQEVLGEVLEKSFSDALEKEELRPAGRPLIEPINFAEGANMEYSATFEVFPEFEVKDIAAETIIQPQAKVSESDIDSMIEKLRKQRMVWTDVERPAQLQDRVTLSFLGKLDGEDFPGNQAEQHEMVLGEGAMVKDFEKNIQGQSADAEIEFDVKFPDDYQAAELAGKTARFSAEIHAVSEGSLPAVDGEFAKAFGVEEGSVQGLRNALRDNMERELGDAVKTYVKQQAMDKVLAVNDILVPQALIEQEVDQLAQQVGFPQPKEGEEESEQSKKLKQELFSVQARQRVALGLIIARIANNKAMKIDPDRVQAHLESIASTYQDKETVINYYRSNQRLMETVHNVVLEGQIVDSLIADATLSEQTMTFDDVMTANEQAAAKNRALGQATTNTTTHSAGETDTESTNEQTEDTSNDG